MSRSVPLVFFDNNLARKILTGKFGGDRGKLCPELQTLLTPPFSTKTSAASLMELLGITSIQIDLTAILGSIKGLSDAGDVYEHIRSKYAELENQISDLLEKKKARQEQYNYSSFDFLWLSLMADCCNDTRNAAAWIAVSLTVDAMQSTKLLSNGRYVGSLMSEIIQLQDPVVQNLSKMRMAYHLWNEFLRCYQRGSPLSKEHCEIIKSVKLKSDKDYADCDLIHMAVNGYANKENERSKVVCATCDPPETIINRIQIYKGFISYVKSIPGHELPLDYELSHNGTVHCFCLNTGRLVQTIDVKRAGPAFRFID